MRRDADFRVNAVGRRQREGAGGRGGAGSDEVTPARNAERSGLGSQAAGILSDQVWVVWMHLTNHA